MAKRMFFAGVSSLTLAAVSAGTAFAQETQSETQVNEDQLDVIFVTAQKRSESLQDVPVAVSAVTGEQLSALGLDNIDDIRIAMPSVNVRNGGGNARSYIRGVGAASLGALAEPSVALYVDGVYMASTSSILSFNSISSIEVYKGPQGTLFGRNATGGLIQVTTRDPSFEPTGSFHVGYGNYQRYSGDAYFSAPLSDTVAMNFAFTGSAQGNGYGTNITTGKDVYINYHNVAFRSKILFEPSDRTTILLNGDLQDNKNNLSNGSQLIPGTYYSAGVLVPTYDSKFDVEADVEPQHASSERGIALTIKHEFAKMSVQSITAYRKTRRGAALDLDYTGTFFSFADTTQLDHQFTQELQVQSDTSGPFTWTVGAFYFDADSGTSPGFVRTTPTVLLEINSYLTAESISVFGQGTYELMPSTRITLGARYTDEKRTIDATTSVNGNPPSINQQTLKFSEPTFRVSLDHDFSPEVMGYVSFNTGFKSGGFTSNGPAYLPEKLTSYEAGLKSELFDRRLRLNLAGFYYDYRDIQVQALVLAGNRVINGAKGEVYGLELDTEAKLGGGLTLTGALAWLHARYKDFPDAPLGSPLGGDVPVMPGSAAGNAFPYAPDFAGTLGLNHRLSLGSGDLITNVGAVYSDRYYAQPDNVISQDPFVQVNASIEYRDDNGYSLRFWMNNITDYVPFMNATNSAPTGRQVRSWSAPRLYGITVGYKF